MTMKSFSVEARSAIDLVVEVNKKMNSTPIGQDKMIKDLLFSIQYVYAHMRFYCFITVKF